EQKKTDLFSEEKFRLIGEAFRTYIIVEYEQKIIVIDKHAAHERVIYEKLKRSDSERTAQVLLSPVSVLLSEDEYSALLSNTELLKEACFDVTDFGQGTVIVNECPMEITPEDIPEIICEIAGNFAENKQSADYDKLDNIYHSVACRSAVKAGNNTSRYEMEIFAKQLLSDPSVKYCPHGRPVLIEITRRELEKNFGRV
ncbi:MAG: DNA mismatch repair protein MutL, partial [Clostridia bacterium]|nr:DNA mismatch repair protein MutL [Clostridia bacterium]